MGKRIYTKRDKLGRFKRKAKTRAKHALVLFSLVVIIATTGYISFNIPKNNPIVVENTLTAYAGETLDARIDALKDETIEELAQCETKGVAEPDAAIVFDTNSQASLGALQFQIKTVQYYVKKLDDKDITRVQAIAIAIDHDEARELAKRIIFELGVTKDWVNCGRRIDLDKTVDIINQLEK